MYSVFDFPGNSGDGYALGYKAGATLTSMEFCQAPMVIKDGQLPLLAIAVTRGAIIKDVLGNIIMKDEITDFNGMFDAHYLGRGPVRIQLSHLPEKEIKLIEDYLFSTERPVVERFMKNRDLDFRKDDLELWPTDFQICGGHGAAGLRVNEKAETAVMGLYAAGDVASVPKQHLSGALVFGEVAAEEAQQYCKIHTMPELDREAIESVLEEHTKLQERKGEINLDDIERKARRFAGDYLISPKHAEKFRSWRKYATMLHEDLLCRAIIENTHDLTHYYELRNILFVMDMNALCGDARKESRWGYSHKRSDYPDVNDRDFLCHFMVRKDENGMPKLSKGKIQKTFSEEVEL